MRHGGSGILLPRAGAGGDAVHGLGMFMLAKENPDFREVVWPFSNESDPTVV